MLSRPVTQEESFCEANNITIADMPTRSCKDMREAQLKDDNLKKIINSFESPLKTEEYADWTERGFLMNQGVLYRYVPDADSAEAQLVIPNAERELIMQRHHNDPMDGHYGEDGTFQKIEKRYYWTGMKNTYPITLRNVQNVLVLRLQTKSLLVCLELQSTHRDLKSLLLIYLDHCLEMTQANNGYLLLRIVPQSGLSYLPFLKPVLVNALQLS
ncbi:transposon Tf2-8 polyprotein [Trichonephila clavipes]|nr:transposon Tf2-8 polyprotein [Trichonephila clavipes]